MHKLNNAYEVELTIEEYEANEKFIHELLFNNQIETLEELY